MAPLIEYFGPQPVTPTPQLLPRVERTKMEAAVNTFNCLGRQVLSMDSKDPRIGEFQACVKSTIDFFGTMERLNYTPSEIRTFAEDSTKHLKERISAYEKSKEGCAEKSLEYSRASAQFDKNIKKGNSNSAPIDFAKGANRDYAPWNGPGINETNLTFPSKENLASCVRQTRGNNPYLNDEKLVGKIADSLAGKTMPGLKMKEEALREVGDMRASGGLEDIPRHPNTVDSRVQMYEVLGNCALNKNKPPESSHGYERSNSVQPPQQKSAPKEQPKNDFSDTLMRAMMLSNLAF